MPQHDRPLSRAVRRDAAPAPDAGRRRHPAELANQLRAVIDALDRLHHDLELGRLTPAQFDRCADVAHEEADKLRAIFRAPLAPTRPPAWVSEDGTRAAW